MLTEYLITLVLFEELNIRGVGDRNNYLILLDRDSYSDARQVL